MSWLYECQCHAFWYRWLIGMLQFWLGWGSCALAAWALRRIRAVSR